MGKYLRMKIDVRVLPPDVSMSAIVYIENLAGGERSQIRKIVKGGEIPYILDHEIDPF
jgi:hypothetical protein